MEWFLIAWLLVRPANEHVLAQSNMMTGYVESFKSQADCEAARSLDNAQKIVRHALVAGDKVAMVCAPGLVISKP